MFVIGQETRMARAYKQGDEPVPGYRLMRFLGRGGFGEVWHATAPGGTEVAFKIIDLSERTGLKEWRAVQRVKKIRHPNLTPILALWLRDKDGNLLEEVDVDPTSDSRHRPTEMYFAMGLGDKSLLDRLKKCKDQGLSGIPVAELLNYLEDAARALDHLNSPRHDLGYGPVAIQHCDVKPQNILVVGDAAQVCDFGLARVLGDNRSTTNAAVTLAFAAPELLEEGKPSNATDQYSLAMTYFYLRTGTLPFSRNDANSVILEALEGRIDLSRLNSAEQQVIRQALARKPASRFPTCLDMARELRRAVEQATTNRTSLVIEAGSEIVPGHKLIKCLGRGAFGEVWEAVAPGRIPVALKITRDLDRAGGRGKQEFKALEIIQRVSHNALMELRAYWLLDRYGQVIPDEIRGRPGAPTPSTLIIATKLADKNLSQLLEEYHAKGEPGIPPRELIGYMKQVAAAIDYLNTPRHRLGDRLVSIQHRDIKPDNIMLVDDSVKLTDFGLAKVVELEEVSAEIHQDSVGFTFHYAAPEVLRGRVTKWSDQYALAITYYHLRTGVLPFERANSAYELMMQQLEGRLDLSYLPEPERRVVAKATSVVPEKRFHTCTAFIESLDKAIPENGIAPLPKKPPLKSSAEVAAQAPPPDGGEPLLEFLPDDDHKAVMPGSTGREDAGRISTPPQVASPRSVSLAPAEAAAETASAPAAASPASEVHRLSAYRPAAAELVPQRAKPVEDDAFGTILAQDAESLLRGEAKLAAPAAPPSTGSAPPVSRSSAATEAPSRPILPGLVEVDPEAPPEAETPAGFRRRAPTMIAVDLEAELQQSPPPEAPPPASIAVPPQADPFITIASNERIEAAATSPSRDVPLKDPKHLALADWRRKDLEGVTSPRKPPPLGPILAVVVVGLTAVVAVALVLLYDRSADHGLLVTGTTPLPTLPGATGAAALGTSPTVLPTAAGREASESPVRLPLITSSPAATGTKANSERLIFGEKRAADPDFPTWLETRLQRLIREVERPEEFARLDKELALVPPERVTPQLLAFRAECVLEGVRDVVEAGRLIEESLIRTATDSGPRAYQHYVRARVHQQANEPILAAKVLDRALSLDAVSATGFRKQRALSIFQDAVQSLPLEVDPATLAVKSGASRDDAAWLTRAWEWPASVQEKPPFAAAVHLALLSDSGTSDQKRLEALLNPNQRAELLRLPRGPQIVNGLLKRLAVATSATDPATAVTYWSELVKSLRDDPTQHDLTPVALYEQVLVPALACVEQLPTTAPPPARIAAAALWTVKGKLLRENPYERWNFPSQLPALREAAAAFGAALKLEPETSRRARAELFTSRSIALILLGAPRLTETDWRQVKADAEAAIQADPEYAGGYYLRGYFGFEQLQRLPPDEAMSLLRTTIRDFDEAIRRAVGQNFSKLDLAYFHISRSSAYGQLGDNLPTAAEREPPYRRALADAETAAGLARDLPLSWSALGQAYERLAWKGHLVNQKDQYVKAEEAYKKQIELRLAEIDGYVALGRLYVRWYADDGGPFDRLSLAERHLATALDMDPDHPEANFWQGRLRLAQARPDQAMPVLRKAVRDPRQGPRMVLNVAEILMRAEDPDLRIANAGRLRELIDLALPAETKARKPIHAQLLILRSNLVRGVFRENYQQCFLDAEEAYELAEAVQIKVAASDASASALLVQVVNLLQKDSLTDDEKRRLDDLESKYIERTQRILRLGPDSPTLMDHGRYAAQLLEKYSKRAGKPLAEREKLLDDAIALVKAARRVAEKFDRDRARTSLTPYLQALEQARSNLR
jgi:serine/threonine protein kinase/tetratricopeptide (TPR) repeat protein